MFLSYPTALEYLNVIKCSTKIDCNFCLISHLIYAFPQPKRILSTKNTFLYFMIFTETWRRNTRIIIYAK